MEKKIIKKINMHIEGLLKQFVNTSLIEDYRNRIDEVFLLYSNITDMYFVDVCDKFGVDYPCFVQIGNFDPKSLTQNKSLQILRNLLAQRLNKITSQKARNQKSYS